MQIVIDIPEEEYNIIKKYNAPMTWAEHLIKKGTPLPKGHGRLIDADVLMYKCFDDYNCDHDHICDRCMFYSITQCEIDKEPTIIEADTESEVTQ